MNMYHRRPTVADMRAMKAHAQKISMLYVTTLDYPEPKHVVTVSDKEFDRFVSSVGE